MCALVIFLKNKCMRTVFRLEKKRGGSVTVLCPVTTLATGTSPYTTDAAVIREKKLADVKVNKDSALKHRKHHSASTNITFPIISKARGINCRRVI